MTLTLRRSRSPFEVGVLLALGVLSIVSAVFFDQAATFTARQLPEPLGHIMYAGTAVAAGVALTGVWWRHDIAGLLIERIGLISLASWTLGYGLAVLAVSGARGIQFGGYMGAVAAMALVRAWQIGREARELSLVAGAAQRLKDESEGA
ncbi:hypothetical protein [Amycolatopsis sp. 195334CR]|uniref:hypothetical protein n=1 Tax=Amycolatopsis sp. 195334CR TaxID=2814588 RepID=UPI001A8BF458|nr:hypothetical protein [Amycolatopsis sp. 195334CR]MBN6037485.1 hypothetical protein [Amycolatopsis sp. 195334CR]